MIYITGDLHGKVERAVSDAKRIGIKQSDTFVLLGDVGVNYYGHGMGDEHRKRMLNRLGITFLCVHGNHEMRPESVGTYEAMQWNGGTVYVEPEFPNLLFAQDGSIFTIEGRKCLVLGGAYSVDKYYRIIRGAKWFADEQPSDFVFHFFVAGEPGGEYLVDNLVGCPVWSEEAFFFPEGLGAVKQPLYNEQKVIP